MAGMMRVPRPGGVRVCRVCQQPKTYGCFYTSKRGTFAGKCKACWALKLPTPPVSLADRFWAKVQKTDSCWLWTGKVNTGGYGHLVSDEGKAAHRASWLLAHGPIPDGLLVCHHCDNPRCVRPDHLFLGTIADNVRDCANKGRIYNGNQKCERNARAKLTWGDVDRARGWHLTGVTKAEIARRIGVSANTISAMLSGRTWRDADRTIGVRVA